MAVLINASTSSGLQLTSDTSGAIAFQKDGTNTLVLPTSGTVTIGNGTGTLYAAGPAFSAYQSSAQSALGSATPTKLIFQTEEFDTANCFDNTTNYRFTPNVAGYYQINGACQINGTTTSFYTLLYKNGISYKYGQYLATSNSGPLSVLSTLVYLNGTTDYIELYAQTGTSLAPFTGQEKTYFNGCFLRGA